MDCSRRGEKGRWRRAHLTEFRFLRLICKDRAFTSSSQTRFRVTAHLHVQASIASDWETGGVVWLVCIITDSTAMAAAGEICTFTKSSRYTPLFTISAKLYADTLNTDHQPRHLIFNLINLNRSLDSSSGPNSGSVH